MKNSRALILALALILISTAAWAQQRFELMPFAGYRTSGSFDVTSLDISNVTIKDGFAYGLTLGFRPNPRFQVEAMWSRVDSKVSAKVVGASTTLFNLTEDQFHLNFYSYFGYAEAKVRPFLLVGLGATILNPKPGERNGVTIDVPAESRFSWSIGGGLEAMFSESVGLRALAKWTPTYINTTSAIWVDWWGQAWIVPVSNYMNQWEFTGGLVFRF